MNSKKHIAALALLGLLAGWNARAASIESTKDWPQFNGPHRDNISHETGLLKEWPKEGPPIAWKIAGIGEGYPSLSVSNGRIFTAGDEGDSSYVFALNEADGKPLWKSKLGASGGGQGYSGPRATPTVDGDLVYMIGQFGDLACYQSADGKEIWRTNVNKDLGGKMMSGWGNSESVVIEADKLLCTPGGSGGTLAALDKKTGKAVWRSTDFTDSAAYMAPVVAEIDGVRQAVLLTAKSVAGVAVADGKLLWRHDRPGSTAVIPTPVIKDRFVYVTSGYGAGCDLFKITSNDGHFNVEKLYSNKGMINHHGGVILLGDSIYGFTDAADKAHREDRGWICQDLMTGDVKWLDKSILGKGSISYADERFYLRDEGKPGTIVLMEAAPDHHAEKGRFDQPQRSNKSAWPHLVIANGHLFVRDQNSLLAYDVKAK